MATNVATLTAKLTADVKDFKQGMGQATKATQGLETGTKKSMTGIQAAVGAAAGFIAVQFAGKALGAVKDFAAASVSAASAVTESTNAVQVTFGNAAQSVIDFAANSNDAFFETQSSAQQMATVMGATLQGMGVDAQQAADQTIMLMKRAGDMASVFDTDVASAIGAVGSALRNEQEPIRKFGVSINAAKIEAEAMANGWVDASGKVTDYGKAQAIVNLIMQQTERVAGDAANTAEEFANQGRHLKEKWEEVKVSVGNALIPVLSELMGIFMDLLPAIAPLFTTIAKFTAGSLSAFVTGIQAIVEWFRNLPGPVQAAAAAIGLVTAALVSGLIPALMALLANPVVLGIAAIATAIMIIGEEAGRSEARVKELKAAFDAAAGAAGELNLKSVFDERTLELLRQYGVNTNDLKEALFGSQPAMDAVRNQLKLTGELLPGTIRDVQLLDVKIVAARDSFWVFQEAIAAAHRSVGDYSDAAEMARGQSGELSDKMHILAVRAGETAGSIDDVISAMLALADPVFAANQATEKYNELLRNVGETGVITAAEIDELTEAYWRMKAANDAITPESIIAYEEAVSEAMADVTAAVEAAGGLTSSAAIEIGEGIQAGIIAGLAGLGRNVGDFIARSVGDALVYVKNDNLITSPSKLWAMEVGLPISEGIAEGILDGIDAPLSAVQELMDRILDEAQAGVDAIFSVIGSYGSLTSAQDRLGRATNDLTRLQEEAARLPGEIGEATARLTDEKRRSIDVTASEQVAIERATSALERIREQYSAGEASLAELTVAEERLTAAIESSTALTRDQEQAQKDLDELLERSTEINADLTAAEDALTAAALRVIQAQQSLIETGEEMNMITAESWMQFQTLAEEAGLTSEQISALADKFIIAQGDINNFQGAVINTDAALTDLKARAEEGAARLDAAGDAATRAGGKARASAGGWRELAAAMADANAPVAPVIPFEPIVIPDLPKGFLPRVGVPLVEPVFKTPGGHIMLHEGGVVPGPPGAEVPAILEAGEEVLSRRDRHRNGGTTIIIEGNVFDLDGTLDRLEDGRARRARRGGVFGN